MARTGRKHTEAKKQIEARPHTVEEAVVAARKAAHAKFDETVELALLLGVDPKHADQMVRGTIVLPHGVGKSKRVVVIAAGEKVREAEEAGADHAGGADIVKRIQEGWTDFDAVVATPDAMKDVGRLGKVLGPRGLMPNPKAGTVTFDVATAVREIKAGKVEFKVDKTSIIHAAVGRLSFNDQQLAENARALILAVLRAKPAAAKGRYMRTIHLSTTMGPSIEINPESVEIAA